LKNIHRHVEKFICKIKCSKINKLYQGYNIKKIYRFLINKQPLKYYRDEVINNFKKSNMLWTLTRT